MLSKITFTAAALALAVSGLASTAYAYDAFGSGDHETVIRQSAQSPAVAGVIKASDWATVGTNAWNGDREGLNATSGLAKRSVATNAR